MLSIYFPVNTYHFRCKAGTLKPVSCPLPPVGLWFSVPFPLTATRRLSQTEPGFPLAAISEMTLAQYDYVLMFPEKMRLVKTYRREKQLPIEI